MTRVDIKDILRDVLRDNEVSSSRYSFGKYVEGAVCIETTVLGLVVYNAEKGHKFNANSYERPVDAFYELISRVAKTKEQEEKIKKDFFNQVMLELCR